MSLSWSFSAERCFRRCQRQYYYRYIAASHSAKDELRREAFVLKQLSALETWAGKVAHKAIEKFVVPALKENTAFNWNQIIDAARGIAERQFQFSRERKFRDAGTTKSGAGDDYAALVPHDLGLDVSQEQFRATLDLIDRGLTNLAAMDDL